MSEHFVPVLLDIDEDMLPEDFGYYAVPTFYVISPKGKRIDRVVGGATQAQFLTYLKKVSGKR